MTVRKRQRQERRLANINVKIKQLESEVEIHRLFNGMDSRAILQEYRLMSLINEREGLIKNLART